MTFLSFDNQGKEHCIVLYCIVKGSVKELKVTRKRQANR